MQIFDGHHHAQLLDEKIADFLKTHSIDKSLVIVQVGDDLSSTKYVNLKKKYCEKFGIPVEIYNINSSNSDEEIYKQVEDIFNSSTIGGGIIQLPLPRESLYGLLNLIPVSKDIDVISSKGVAQFYAGDLSRLSPVVRATQYFMKQCHIDSNIDATLIGEGVLVGKPLSYFLAKTGHKVQIIQNYTTGTPLSCHLLVLSAGVPNLVHGEDITPQANVIDFGSSVVDSKTVGDLDLNSNLNHLNFVSPSPGGMGPLVIRFLVMNFLGL